MTARADGRWAGRLAALRLPHWVKNVLVFVPLLLAHQVTDLQRVLAALAAFLAFGLTASAGYVVNDLVDREADRLHPRKRSRPLAAGVLAPRHGVVLGAAAAAAGYVVALAALPPLFAIELAAYLALSLGYTFWLKRYPVADVLLLAGFYTVRLMAGATAVRVPLSPWAASFALFLFLSLAFVKRHAELVASAGDPSTPVRGYQVGDRAILQSLGPASGYLAVLVLALYINSDAVTELYRRPAVLWLMVPILLFWITRLWFRAHRGVLHDDPMVDTASDPVSYAVLGAAVAAAIAAL